MKITIKLLLVLASSLLLFSCTKSTENLLQRKDGKWKLLMQGKYLKDGVMMEEHGIYEEEGHITFNDGTYTFTDEDGDAINGKWAMIDDSKIVLIDEDRDSETYNILESSKDKQKWESKQPININNVDAVEHIEIWLTK